MNLDPRDFKVDVPADSFEARVGYSSLIRQLHAAYAGTVAFYRSKEGGSLTPEKAREKAFHSAENPDEAKKVFSEIMSFSYEDIDFEDLHRLHGYAPRVAERLWERITADGRPKFESVHLAATSMFPVHYMKNGWNIARYLGIRESMVEE